MDIESEKQMNELAELKLDRDRLNWLLRDTTFLTGISTRKKIDKAMEDDWFDRERHNKIMS